MANQEFMVVYRFWGTIKVSGIPLDRVRERVEEIHATTDLLLTKLDTKAVDIVDINPIDDPNSRAIALIDDVVSSWQQDRDVTFEQIHEDATNILQMISDAGVRSILRHMIMTWKSIRPGIPSMMKDLNMIRKLLS